MLFDPKNQKKKTKKKIKVSTFKRLKSIKQTLFLKKQKNEF
jgi:hypothetical protein